MLISEERKFIFIAVPKTGSTSIESHLMSLAPGIRRNEVPRPDGTWVPVHKHATACSIKAELGDRMSEYTVVAFIRDPVSTVVSKYYYYRVGRGAQRARQWKFTKHLMQTRLRVLSALILPLRTWARVYPYSMTHEFLLDEDQNMLVDKIGNFDDLQSDFERIFSSFGFPRGGLKLPTMNKTRAPKSKHENDVILKKIVMRKAALDTQIFRDFLSHS